MPPRLPAPPLWSLVRPDAALRAAIMFLPRQGPCESAATIATTETTPYSTA
eukprot:SAG22_NODE_15899_length_337_cov_1.084034_1_plen_50_part_10